MLSLDLCEDFMEVEVRQQASFAFLFSQICLTFPSCSYIRCVLEVWSEADNLSLFKLALSGAEVVRAIQFLISFPNPIKFHPELDSELDT